MMRAQRQIHGQGKPEKESRLRLQPGDEGWRGCFLRLPRARQERRHWPTVQGGENVCSAAEGERNIRFSAGDEATCGKTMIGREV